MSLTLSAADQILVIAYLVGILMLGLFKAGKDSRSTSEFLIAGRKLSLGAFVATLVATFYGGILGVGEFTYRYGLVSWLTQGFFYYVFAGFYAFFLAPRIQKQLHFTLPDQLYNSYGRSVGLLGSLFTFILVSPAPYVLMCGTLLHLIMGCTLIQGILAGAGFSTLYVLLGGFRSVVRTDILQFVLMFLGFAIVLPFAWSELGSLAEISDALPRGHLRLFGELPWQKILAWAVIALWTIISPSFFQRCSAARSPHVARRGLLIAVACWFLFDMMTLTAGFYAVAGLPDIEPLWSYPLLAERVLPPVAKGIFLVGLLSIIMSTLDSMSFLSAITLGRDFIWRLRGASDQDNRVRTFTRLGLILSTILSILIALFFESVIDIWYVLGSLAVPVLLLPLLTSLFPRLRLPHRSTLLMMVATAALAAVWILIGYARGTGSPAYPWAIEPMHPALLLSLGWWGSVWMHSRRGQKT